MFLTQTNLVHYLLSRDVVTADAVVDGDFGILEVRRRNRNFRVMRNQGDGLFVKQIPSLVPETVMSLRREAACYRLTATIASLSALRRYAPQLVDYNPVKHVIVTKLIEGARSLMDYHLALRHYPAQLGGLLGRALGELHIDAAAASHAISATGQFTGIAPWVLSIARDAESVMPSMSTGSRALVAVIRQTPGLSQALLDLHAGWRPICLIHGDVKWDNFMLIGEPDAEPSAPGAALRVVDWELADLGEPAWDVGCALAAWLQHGLLTITATTPGNVTGDTVRATWPAIAAFWAGYVEAAGLVPSQARELLHAAMRFVGARLVLTAFELLASASTLTPQAALCVHIATAILGDPARMLEELLGLRFVPLAAVARPRAHPAVPAPERASPRRSADAFPPDTQTRLDTLLRTTEILSETQFRFGDGEPIQLAALASPRADRASPDPLADALVPLLYHFGYARGEPGPVPSSAMRALAEHTPFTVDAAFTAQLSAANRSRDRWDPGWQVYQVGEAGSVHVRKGDGYRRAIPGEFAFSGGPARMPALGDHVDLLCLRESHTLQSGFYFIFGETVASEFDDANIVRLYFNAPRGAVAALVDAITTQLNTAAVPFRMKCLTVTPAPSRADACVVFIARRFLDFALALLYDRPDVLALLRPAVPMFTKALAPGVGAAEEPGGMLSFGQTRCLLVARGLAKAWRGGLSTHDDRLRTIVDEFAAAGLSPDQPYLNQGSADLAAARAGA